ncbi:MAG: 3-hydroxybutyryl-CoA dehydrogenase [Deltaproteobacteria bacterium]|nr:3-hydroxybutyryl-CoA dehydrogenase [Deltaproteobacteria bacterium]TLN02615.1 MAG: 3-hydroxybutyryl-CoA dehydrogenase [bacterium]
MEKIMVVGAGTMGSGIAQTAVACGCSVVLADIDEQRAIAAVGLIGKRLERRTAAGKISPQEKELLLSRISTTTSLEDCAAAELIIEAASERESIKQAIFRRLDALAPTTTIFASNTSAISITRLAAVTTRPERFIGMHFMNPAHIMELVEVIPGLRTSPEVVATIRALSERMGKKPVVVADAPGFVANRLLMPAINEAIQTLQEGIATREDIDLIMKLGAGQPMGPLELADFIGLDVCLDILETLHRELGEKFRPCPLLRKMVEGGKFGRKNGEGFYDYR